MNLYRNGPQYFATLAATLGNLVMGTCIGWSSPASPLLQLPPDQVRQGRHALSSDSYCSV